MLFSFFLYFSFPLFPLLCLVPMMCHTTFGFGFTNNLDYCTHLWDRSNLIATARRSHPTNHDMKHHHRRRHVIYSPDNTFAASVMNWKWTNEQCGWSWRLNDNGDNTNPGAVDVDSTPPPPAPVPHRKSSSFAPDAGTSPDVQITLKDIRTTLQKTQKLPPTHETSGLSDKPVSPEPASPVWIPR